MENLKIKLARYIRLIKQGLTDYRWLLFYIQRMDYNPNHRKFVSSIIAKLLPKTSNHQLSTEEKKLSGILKEDGAVVIDSLVNMAQVQEMRAYLSTKICIYPHSPDEDRYGSSEFSSKTSTPAYYSPEDAVGIPHLWELANNPKILNIIENRFGAKPTISLLWAWWVHYGLNTETNASEINTSSPTEFHRDIDDWLQIRLFIYLTDVDENAGPHAFIRSSQKWVLPLKSRTVDLNDPDLPMKDNLVKLTGEAGMAWLGDTYALHRGIIPTKKHRLIIAVTYTLFPLPAFFPESLALKASLLPCQDRKRFDPYINRVYLQYE